MITKPPNGHPAIKNCINFANFYLEFTTSSTMETSTGKEYLQDIVKPNVQIPDTFFDTWDLESTVMRFKFDDYDLEYAKQLDIEYEVRPRWETKSIYRMIPFRYQEWMSSSLEARWFYRIKHTKYLYAFNSEHDYIQATFVFEKASDAVMFKMRFSDE